MTIYDSIVEWANQLGDFSQDTENSFRKEMKKLRPGYSADNAQRTELLNHVLETVKDRSCQRKLSGNGLHNLSLLAAALQATAPLLPKLNILARIKSTTPQAIKSRIDKELLALKRQKLLDPNWVKNAGQKELEHLLAEAIPLLSQQDVKKVYDTLVSRRRPAIAAILADSRSEALKPLVKFLYRHGVLSYEIDRCLHPANETIVEALREEIKLRPRWTIGNLFSNKGEYVFTLRNQNKGSYTHGGDTLGARLIAKAAAIVCSPSASKSEIELLTKSIFKQLGSSKDFTTLASNNIAPSRNVGKEAQTLEIAFRRLEYYLPKQKSVGILDRVTHSLAAKRLEFFILEGKPNKSTNDLQKMEQLFYAILDQSRLSPRYLHKVIERIEDNTSKQIFETYQQEKDLHQAIDKLERLYLRLDMLCQSAPYKDYPEVKAWQHFILKSLQAS